MKKEFEREIAAEIITMTRERRKTRKGERGEERTER
jgi:hypothetical protein